MKAATGNDVCRNAVERLMYMKVKERPVILKVRERERERRAAVLGGAAVVSAAWRPAAAHPPCSP